MSGPVDIRRLAVTGKSHDARVADLIATIVASADKRGVEVLVESDVAPPGVETFTEAPEGAQVLLTLGGDGTLLRGARLVAGRDVPILGINLGRLGFLTTAPTGALERALDQLFAGDWSLDRRSTLDASVEGQGHAAQGFLALNDVVVHTSGMARVVRLRVTIGDGEEIASFAGDGVIVSTPTGSTAYSLSAGGPVVAPGVACTVVTPICPHILSVRPLVVPAESVVQIEPTEESAALFLTVDGQVAHKLVNGDRVRVRTSGVQVPLVRLPGYAFFATLREKLGWGHRTSAS